MRDEERHLYLVDGEPESAEEEYLQLLKIGVDGFFTDFPSTAVGVFDTLNKGDVKFLGTTTVLNSGEQPYPGNGFDLEGLYYYPEQDNLFFTSEEIVNPSLVRGSWHYQSFCQANFSYWIREIIT